jgi:hypothetical protein
VAGTALAVARPGYWVQAACGARNALERKGFLRIAVDDHDARIRRLHTTERSHAYWQQRSAADQQHVLSWFSGLTEQEAGTLFELLLRLQHGISAQHETKPAPAHDNELTLPSSPRAPVRCRRHHAQASSRAPTTRWLPRTTDLELLV